MTNDLSNNFIILNLIFFFHLFYSEDQNASCSTPSRSSEEIQTITNIDDIITEDPPQSTADIIVISVGFIRSLHKNINPLDVIKG